MQALVDGFEAGVRRAQLQAVDAPAPQLVASGRPGGGGAAPLSRRVPGATLDSVGGTVPLGNAISQQPPPDPDAARVLVEQFEAGVLRALHDARSDHQ